MVRLMMPVSALDTISCSRLLQKLLSKVEISGRPATGSNQKAKNECQFKIQTSLLLDRINKVCMSRLTQCVEKGFNHTCIHNRQSINILHFPQESYVSSEQKVVICFCHTLPQGPWRAFKSFWRHESECKISTTGSLHKATLQMEHI